VDQSTAQLLTAGIGIGGTLAAALLTQSLARLGERERRAADDQTRWLGDRLRASTRMLAGALALERDLWSACSHLDPDTRAERMPGHTTILLTPESGLPGIFDQVTREILVEAVEDAFQRLDQLEEVVAEIGLVGSTEEGRTALKLHKRLWDVAGLLEGYADFDSAADAVFRCRSARDAFSEAARRSLRVAGPHIAADPADEELEIPSGLGELLAAVDVQRARGAPTERGGWRSRIGWKRLRR